MEVCVGLANGQIYLLEWDGKPKRVIDSSTNNDSLLFKVIKCNKNLVVAFDNGVI